MADKLRYYLPSEVVIHNKPDDVWVSFLGKVYDVTKLVSENKGKKIAKFMMAHAGKDISQWFDERTKNVKKVVHPASGLKVPYTHKVIPYVPVPSAKWMPDMTEEQPDDGQPWWLDKCEEVGHLTRKARPIRVINVLAPPSHRSNLIWVASEETVDEIVKRVLPHNSHAGSYTLKFEGRVLRNMKTLDENKIIDERDKFTRLGLTDDNYIPAIKLYYNDDLTRL